MLLMGILLVTLHSNDVSAENLLDWGMSIKVWDTASEEFKADFIRYEDKHETWNREMFPMVFRYKVLAESHPAQQRLNYAYSKFGNKVEAERIVLTLIDENRRMLLFEQSSRNEWGLPQLQFTYHEAFIQSNYFMDWFNQVDYMVDVYYDWKYRKWGTNPRAGWYKTNLHKDLLEYY